LHGAIVKIGPKEEEQEVGRIEKAGLDVADEGRATIEMGVPKGQGPLLELAGCKAIGWAG